MPRPTVSTTFNAIDKVTGPMKKITKNVKTFAVGATVAFAATAAAAGKVVQSVNKFAEAGDEIAKTSRIIGLSVESLQELRFAADRSGVSADTFSTAMQKLNKNVGDLQAGTGTLTTLLNKTNPALAEQLKLAESNEEAFNLLVEQIANIENPMERAALAQAAFGRAGQDLIVMAENGVDGINALREEARKYGNVISTEAATASEQFVDSMTNMRSAIQGVKNRALAPLMTALQPVIQSISDWVAANQDLINQKIQNTITAIGKAAQLVAKLWNNGLIPAVLAGVAAFKILTTGLAAYKAIMVAVKAVQIGLNVAMAANPIGLIIAGVTALIAITVLLIKNWEKVKTVILGIWEKIKVPFEKVSEFFGGVKGTQADTSAAQSRGMAAAGGNIPGMMSANQGMLSTQTTTVNRSVVDINMAGLPNGSSVRQKGQAQGVSLNYGYGGGSL